MKRMASTTSPVYADKNISAEKSGIFTPTLNMMGWQQNALDEYLTEFVNKSRNFTRPVADVGCAYGFVTKKLLDEGLTVIANDLEKEHLSQLWNELSPEQQSRLKCHPGSVLDVELPAGSLDGVVAARLLQFFTTEAVRKSCDLFYSWLAPGGYLCITNTSPYRGTTDDFIAQYEKNKADGMEWPGITTTDSLDKNRQKRIVVAQTGYRFDPEVLAREARRVGFKVLKCSYYSTPFLPDEFRSADGVRDAIGLMAVKE
ncbi:uncharacterized protein LOC129584539 [Paramacrobiotus metropolitanus]|uniref:uncharacterized protein LOC129584539 n=1 Tax=Paramacrobiotus metropolitanus TaxID=2943436 RepID=UPI0024461B2E|nr:uncharacterized protein LOC129584539 [Paramacrobiotus metropolitanus]